MQDLGASRVHDELHILRRQPSPLQHNMPTRFTQSTLALEMYVRSLSWLCSCRKGTMYPLNGSGAEQELLPALILAFPATRQGASADKLHVQAAKFSSLVGLATSNKDPINQGKLLKNLYRHPPAGAHKNKITEQVYHISKHVERGGRGEAHLQERAGDKGGNPGRDDVGQIGLVVPADGAVIGILDAHIVLRVGDEQARTAQYLS